MQTKLQVLTLDSYQMSLRPDVHKHCLFRTTFGATRKVKPLAASHCLHAIDAARRLMELPDASTR